MTPSDDTLHINRRNSFVCLNTPLIMMHSNFGCLLSNSACIHYHKPRRNMYYCGDLLT
jgi:hypothetical protein